MSRLLPADGRVAIAVATTGGTREDCLAQARAAAEEGADVVELRVDLLGEVAAEITPDPAPVALAASRAGRAAADLTALWGRSEGPRVLVTLRSATEGGGARLDDGSYRAFVRALVDELAAMPGDMRPAALDVEIARGGTAELVAAAHAAGLDVVLSVHDIDATPQDAVMLGHLRSMAQAGADAAKLAVMPRNAHDVARLLGVTALADEELGIPVITVSMGAIGAVSRVSGAVFGSALTFATAETDPSAPGQLPIEAVRRVHDLLNPGA